VVTPADGRNRRDLQSWRAERNAATEAGIFGREPRQATPGRRWQRKREVSAWNRGAACNAELKIPSADALCVFRYACITQRSND
jgi:hypothetical protein